MGNTEKEIFRKMMWRVADFCGVEILTYCLMNNHFHILASVSPVNAANSIGDDELIRRVRVLYGKQSQKAQDIISQMKKTSMADALRKQLQARMGNVSVFMKELKQRYSIWFNHTHGKKGALWSGRFRSVLVGGEQALSMIAAYIDLNPIRAGITKDPKDYRWSGYGEAVAGSLRARRGLCRIFHPHQTSSWASAHQEYRKFLYVIGEHRKGSASKEKPGAVFSKASVLKVLKSGGKLPIEELIRCRVRYFTYGMVLGSKDFVEAWFQANRNRMPSHRKTGARRMMGTDKRDIAVFRDLKRDVFG